MKAIEWKKRAMRELSKNGCPYPEADAAILTEFVTGLSGAALRFCEKELTQDEHKRLDDCLEARAGGEPVQYITGEAYFMGLRFKCDARALIPRADTECLCEEAIARLGKRPSCRVLDLCCGTGCIGLAIAHFVPGARVTLSDVAAEALSLARENADALGEKCGLCRGDMFSALDGEKFDLIACNPPYIRRGDIALLSPEVGREPLSALDGGPDGLDFYRVLAREAGAHLLPGGVLLAEIGYDQREDMASLFPGCTVFEDAGGNARVMIAERDIVWDTNRNRGAGSRGN